MPTIREAWTSPDSRSGPESGDRWPLSEGHALCLERGGNCRPGGFGGARVIGKIRPASDRCPNFLDHLPARLYRQPRLARALKKMFVAWVTALARDRQVMLPARAG